MVEEDRIPSVPLGLVPMAGGAAPGKEIGLQVLCGELASQGRAQGKEGAF